MPRQIIVGDVHGCLRELKTLTSKLRLTGEDHLVFVGDLIDKGPDSVGVVDWVQNISRSTCRVSVCLGNHEEKLLRWIGHQRKQMDTGEPSPMSDLDGRLQQLATQLSDNNVSYLQSFPIFIRLPEPALTLVTHAGIEGALTKLPETSPTRDDVSSKVWRSYSGMLRVRYLDAFGQRVPMPPDDSHLFWADGYDGRFGRVVFGHHTFLQEHPMEFRYATGIDLGCVYGGYLIAMVFDTELPSARVEKVPAQGRYFI